MTKRQTVCGIVMGITIVALGGLNLYQYLSRSTTPATPATPVTPTASTTPATPAALPASERSIVDQYHKLFYDSEVWLDTRWFGIQTWQNPNDVWIHQEVIFDVKPDFIVEAGTHRGGSAALWATILGQINPQGRVITIDIEDKSAEAKKLPIVKEKVDFLIGSSTDPAIIAQVAKQVQGKKVLVILDSLHTKEHVLKELEVYSPFITVGSYLIVQDTNINGHPVLKDFGPGPMEAVEVFLAKDNRFVSDASREYLLFTQHPKGYLKRVK